MKIKKWRYLIMGLTEIILAVICFFEIAISRFQSKYLLGGIVLAVLAFLNFIFAFHGQAPDKEPNKTVDERDQFIAMKSGHTTLKILNYFLFSGGFGLIILYYIIKVSLLLVAGLTLFTVIIALFVIILIVNNYYEKRL